MHIFVFLKNLRVETQACRGDGGEVSVGARRRGPPCHGGCGPELVTRGKERVVVSVGPRGCLVCVGVRLGSDFASGSARHEGRGPRADPAPRRAGAGVRASRRAARADRLGGGGLHLRGPRRVEGAVPSH